MDGSCHDSLSCTRRTCRRSRPKDKDPATPVPPTARLGATPPVLSWPYAPVTLLWQHRRLIFQLAKRDVIGRYRGSRMGLLWSVLQPLLLLALYTFVFGTIFNMRWGGPIETSGGFATVLFAGLIIHGFFAECVTRAPGLVLANTNYVKRVVFPLEVLPWVALLGTLFHTAVNCVVLVVFVASATHGVPWTLMLAPLVLLPLVLFTVGATWFLAALGVYLRDVGQTIGLLVTLLLFLSPVFYPLSAVPARYRAVVEWNFLTPAIEQFRAVTIFGGTPEWTQWLLMVVAGWIVAAAGLYWFQRSRRGFADVL